MNLVDLLILLFLVSACAHGVLVGGATQALSFAGLAVGFLAGSALAEPVSQLANAPLAKAFLSLLTLLGTTMLVGYLGRQLGMGAWRRLRKIGLGHVDAAVGAAIAGLTALVGTWLIGGVLANLPAQPLAAEIQQSVILRRLHDSLPPVPSVISRLQRLINARGLPQVFAELTPQPSPALPSPADAEVRAAAERAARSTVKVTGEACGAISSGSGFVAASDLVITNAHVVAGVRAPVVTVGGARRGATTVFFDPNLDIAVLRVSVNVAPLDLVDGPVPRGTTAAVLGFPGGGQLDVEPAVVLSRLRAVGRDIYGRSLTTRTVYEIQAEVRAGNSGGPVVRTDGSVAGVVFSRSTVDDGVGYAVTSDEVEPHIGQAQRQRQPVSTGPCMAE